MPEPIEEVLAYCQTLCRLVGQGSPAYWVADHIIYILSGDHPGCLYEGGHPSIEEPDA